MGKCLITKLNGIVPNSSLGYLGKLTASYPVLEVPTASKQTFIVLPIDLEIKMLDGYLTDNNLSSNLGSEGKTTGLSQYVSNGGKFTISSKYQLTQITASSMVVNLDELSACKELTTLQLSSDKVYGNIANLENCPLKYITLRGENVYGDISNISKHKYTEFNLSNCTSLYGNVDFLKDSLNLSSLFINNCDRLTGDVAISSDNLQDVQLNGMNHLYGDLSKLGKNVFFFANNNGDSKFTWKGTRASEAKIIAFQGAVNFGDDVDAVLNNLANCTASSESAAWLKTISIKGTRTNASDTALNTLTNKGYTVYVDPA